MLPNLRRGVAQAPMLVDLSTVHGLADIVITERGLSLGACVTLARLATDPTIELLAPALGQAARSVAGPAHRSSATLGGNLCQDTRCVFYNQSDWWRGANSHCLKHGGTVCHVAPQGERCHAAFSGDLAPALLVLQAEVEIASAKGVRIVPLPDLYHDDGAAHLRLANGEVLTRMHLPAPIPGLRSAYRKARTRAAMDFPLAGVACALMLHEGEVRATAGTLADLRMAITGTNSRPFLLDRLRAVHRPACRRGIADALEQARAETGEPDAQHRHAVALPAPGCRGAGPRDGSRACGRCDDAARSAQGKERTSCVEPRRN